MKHLHLQQMRWSNTNNELDNETAEYSCTYKQGLDNRQVMNLTKTVAEQEILKNKY